MDLATLIRSIFEERPVPMSSKFQHEVRQFFRPAAMTKLTTSNSNSFLNQTVLKLVIKAGTVDDLQFVVERCGALLMNNGWGPYEYPTRLAAERRDADLLRALVKHGVGFQDSNNDPIVFGILKGQHEDPVRTMNFLTAYVELGGKLDVINEFGESLPSKVVERQWWTVAAWLIGHGGPSALQAVFRQESPPTDEFIKHVLPISLSQQGRCSPSLEIEALELTASHVYREELMGYNARGLRRWISTNMALQSWLHAIERRQDLELPHEWHTDRKPFTGVDLVSSKEELMKCISEHAQGGNNLIVQCLLLQEKTFGTIDFRVAEIFPGYKWRSANELIDLLMYLSQFEVDMTAVLFMPHNLCSDIKLANICDLISLVLERSDESWDRAMAEFVLEVFHNDADSRWIDEIRELNLEQHLALNSLVSRQPWMEDFDFVNCRATSI